MTNATMSMAAPAAAKSRTRVNWTPAERAEWLALFEKSNQSVSEFCRANDLPPATLSLWRSQQPSAAANTEDGGLLEIPIAGLIGEPEDAPAVKVHLPNGVRLDLVVGTDLAWLGALLKVLMNAST
jgi:transposase-like protein